MALRQFGRRATFQSSLDSDEHKHDLYRMMPFALQFHITQNGIPRLFDAFKNASLPFEIREVRINHDSAKPSAPSSGGSNFGFNESRPSGGGGTQANTSLLPGEVQMEIRGVVYLAQPFDEKKLGTPPPADGAPTDQVTAAR